MIYVSLSPSQILDVTNVTLNRIRIHFQLASASLGKAETADIVNSRTPNVLITSIIPD